MYLRVTATYEDGEGEGKKTVVATSAYPVRAFLQREQWSFVPLGL